MYHVKSNGLVALQERLEDAAAAVKATAMVMKEQEQVHGAGRDEGDGGRACKMQGPGEREFVAEEGL